MTGNTQIVIDIVIFLQFIH